MKIQKIYDIAYPEDYLIVRDVEILKDKYRCLVLHAENLGLAFTFNHPPSRYYMILESNDKEKFDNLRVVDLPLTELDKLCLGAAGETSND